MSSYIETPYQIETRRLQGIVNDCRADLNASIRALNMQRERIAAIESELREKERQTQEKVTAGMIKGTASHYREMAASAAQAADLRSELNIKLNHIRTQLRIESGMESIERRISEITVASQRAGNDIALLHSLDQQADQCQEDFLAEVKRRAESTGSTQVIKQQHAAFVFGEKGVSLGNIEEAGTKRYREKLSDLFARRLEEAMSSPYADRLPSLKRLHKEFMGTADYEKDLFARQHEEELDKLTAKLAAMDSSGKATEEKRTVSEQRYLALCSLLETEPDQELLGDKSSAERLDALNKKMFAAYKKRKEHEYVANAFAQVLGRHNIEFQDGHATEFGNQFSFAMEDAMLSVSSTDSGILSMEVTGVYSGAHQTANDVRKSVSSAARLCSSMKQICDELASEFGIYFTDVRTEDPTEETMVMMPASQRSSGGRSRHESTLKSDRIGD